MFTHFLVMAFVFIALRAESAPTVVKTKEVSTTTPNFSASGSAILTSHFINKGLSMSNRNPALNAQLLLNMGSQFKLGFWGSNISNVTSTEDHFWVQYQGVIVIDFNPTLKTSLTVADHRFYTSQQRNGQSLSIKGDWKKKYYGLIEFQTNFEGTGSGSQYFNGGYIYKWKGPWLAAGYVGYTIQQASGLNNFLDFKAEGIYQPIEAIQGKLGITGTSDGGQLNGRGQFTYYLAGEFLF